MKKSIIPMLAAATFLFAACNNDGKDSVEKADSINKANMDTASTNNTSAMVTTDATTSKFLTEAAAGGMMEVQYAQVATIKAANADVKKFAEMMVKDHSAANDKVMALANHRSVTLPSAITSDQQKTIDDASKMSGKDFDKDYINDMVKGHENTIDLFEKGSSNVNDTEVKTFIDNTLPTLRMHLDAVKAIQKKMK